MTMTGEEKHKSLRGSEMNDTARIKWWPEIAILRDDAMTVDNDLSTECAMSPLTLILLT